MKRKKRAFLSQWKLFENYASLLLIHSEFLKRVLRSFLLALTIIFISLCIGVAGYHYFDELPWVDAYLDAAMTASGVGAVTRVRTESGKIFAGSYALYSGFMLLVTTSVILAPILHRILHRMHPHDEEEEDEDAYIQKKKSKADIRKRK